MDLTTTAAAAATAAPNSLDKENEAPPATTQSNKSLSFTNGALRKQSQNHQPPQPVAAVVAYRECLKNHAASLGGHAVDGCGEFMASPTSNPTDPTSLKCAACGCHRNFHRRDDDLALTPTAVTTHFLDFHRHPPPPPPRRSSPFSSPSPPPPHHPSHFASATHMLLALSSDTHPAVVTPATPTAAKAQNPSGRKRFRTKFSQDQKEKMFSFSEKLGWKLQKSDEGIVDQFCSEIGVGKGVLKVWMHNNKHTFPKKESNSTSNNSNHGHNHHDDSNNGVHLQASANGSPSSA